jgi:hypothetical protein
MHRSGGDLPDGRGVGGHRRRDLSFRDRSRSHAKEDTMSQTHRNRRGGHVPRDRTMGSGAAPTPGGPLSACGSRISRFAWWGTSYAQIGRSEGFRRYTMV